MTTLNSFRRKLLDWFFTIDLRSLGLFRLALAAVLIWHWATRWPWIPVMYSRDGVLPAEILPKWGMASADGARELVPPFPSLLSWLDQWPVAVYGFFLVALVVYALFLIGYRTRLFGFLSLVVFSAIAHRNPYVLIGADFVLGSFLLWAQVLPLGARFSVDAIRRALKGGVTLRSQPLPEGEFEPTVAAPRQSPYLIGAFGVVLQLGLIYLGTAIWKTGPTWWKDGTASYYLLWMDQYAYPAAEWLRGQPLWLFKLLTRATLVLEYAALPGLLLPIAQPHLRRLTVLCLAGLHVSIAVVVDAGLFSYAMMAAFPLLMTARDWDLLKRLLCKLSLRTTAYYDDDCGVCTKSVELATVLDRLGNITAIGASDTAARRHTIPKGLTNLTVVVFDDRTGAMYTKTHGMALLAACLPLPFHVLRLLALPGIVWLSDIAYDLFAHNRGYVSRWLGLTACGVPKVLPPCNQGGPGGVLTHEVQGGSPSQRLWNVLGGLLLLVVLLANCNENYIDKKYKLPTFLWDLPTRFAAAYQHWNMFAPDAPKYDMWWVAKSRTRAGEEIDLFADPPVLSMEHPKKRRFSQIKATYMKYALSHPDLLPQAEIDPLRAAFCRCLAEQFNAARPPESHVATIELLRMKRSTNLAADNRWEESLLLAAYDHRSGGYRSGPDLATFTTWYPADKSGEERLRSRGPTRAKDSLGEGIWTIWSQDGSVGEGPVSSGKSVGTWTWQLPGDLEARGEFADGQRQGVWIVRWPNGKKQAEGRYENGQRTGIWTLYLQNGKRNLQVQFVNDEQHGPGVSWHPNGQVMERGEFRYGKRDGPWTFYHPNGRKKAEGSYRADKEHGPWTRWHQDGSKAEEGTFADGKREGPWIFYHPNGRKQAEGSYRADKEHGPWTRWHPDGSKAEEGTFVDGELRGPRSTWPEGVEW